MRSRNPDLFQSSDGEILRNTPKAFGIRFGSLPKSFFAHRRFFRPDAVGKATGVAACAPPRSRLQLQLHLRVRPALRQQPQLLLRARSVLCQQLPLQLRPGQRRLPGLTEHRDYARLRRRARVRNHGISREFFELAEVTPVATTCRDLQSPSECR